MIPLPMFLQPHQTLWEKVIEVGGPAAALALIFSLLIVWLIRAHGQTVSQLVETHAKSDERRAEAFRAAFELQAKEHAKAITALAGSIERLAESMRSGLGELGKLVNTLDNSIIELATLYKHGAGRRKED